MKPDPRVMEEWEAKVRAMSIVECEALIKRLRKEEQRSGKPWNVNTRCVYGMLMNRVKVLRYQEGVRRSNERDEVRREDERRANEKILLASGSGGVCASGSGRMSPRWGQEVKARRARWERVMGEKMRGPQRGWT